jgi:hypothetical protein
MPTRHSLWPRSPTKAGDALLHCPCCAHGCVFKASRPARRGLVHFTPWSPAAMPGTDASSRRDQAQQRHLGRLTERSARRLPRAGGRGEPCAASRTTSTSTHIMGSPARCRTNPITAAAHTAPFSYARDRRRTRHRPDPLTQTPNAGVRTLGWRRIAAYRVVSQNIDPDASHRPRPQLCADARSRRPGHQTRAAPVHTPRPPPRAAGGLVRRAFSAVSNSSSSSA